MNEDASGSSSEEDSKGGGKESEQNSWEEDSSSDSSGEEEVEVNDSDSEVVRPSQNINKREETKDSSEHNDDDDQSSESSSGSSDNERIGRKDVRRQKSKSDQKVWEENPDIYGIRRSGRQRKEPERQVFKTDSESDDDSVTKTSKKTKKDRGKGWIPTLTDTESEDSDSSYDRPQRPQRQQRKQQRGRPAGGRKLQARTLSTSSSEYVKKSKKKKKSATYAGLRRNATKEVSYKEDSEDATDSDDIVENEELEAAVEYTGEAVETIEKIMRHRNGRKGETGAQTTMYAVEAEEIKAKGQPDPEVDEIELHFLIKWKGWSNLHNTWESNETLVAQKCDGMKKLDNYVKKMDDINRWKEISTPEDVEYFEYQVEMNEDIQIQYQKVERIIAHQFTAESSSSYPDYYCKWQGLPYSDCTWEDGALAARFFQNEIDTYLERERSDLIPVKNAKCLKSRPKFVAFKAQPTFLGNKDLQLRDYQLDGLNWLVHAWHRETSVILADEMGLGKTIQSISFLSVLFFSHSLYGPFLLVVPLSTLDSWQREFSKWCPDMNVITYIGDVNSRTRIREYEWYLPKSKKIKFNALITTYEILLRDKDLLGSLHWAALVVDEAHRLKNEDSLLYRVLIDFHTNFRLLVTGTPLQNSLKELWSLMHFIMPRSFEDWEYFESNYSVSDKEGLTKLHRDLEPYLIRRIKKDVEKSLPAKVEQILRVEMSQIQKQYYKLILTKNVQELCRELKGSFSGLLNIIVELKKCCNHSCLIKPHEDAFEDPKYLQVLINGSGKMILLDKLLCRLKETGHRVLIFSQMVRLLDIIADYLYLKKFQFQRLDGSIKGETRTRALDHFNAENSQDFCFLLSTRAGGLGINLATADTVIIFDSDWNPQNDLQAMARAHRIGQKKQVSIYRFVTKCSIEEDIIERAKKKMVLDHLIIQTMDTTGKRVLSNTKTPNANAPFNKEELSSILKFGAEELFKDADDDSDQKLQAMDIDEILKRAETQETQESSVGKDLLSQFKVVNYATFEEEEIKEPAPTAMEKLWEEIIPEEERKKAQELIEKEKQEEILKPRNRKQVQTTTTNSRKKEIKSKEIVESDSSSSSSESEAIDDPDVAKSKKAPKKKMGNKALKKDGVRGFTDGEIRRFIKSFKKFARPLTRLDSIAEDAELMEKSTAELVEIGELLKSSCEQAVKEYQEKLLQDECFDGKKKGASIRISGVAVNAPSVLKAEVEKEPLATALPQDPKDQLSFRLAIPTRNVHWGVQWGVIEDSMLLLGMLIYGVGNWDAIKNDPKLELSSKILPIGNGKPQDKHLNTRAEYLLKLLKEHCEDHDKMVTKKEKKKTASEKKDRQISETKVEKEEKSSKKSSATVPDEEKEKAPKKKSHKASKDKNKDKEKEKAKEQAPKKEKKKKEKKAKNAPAIINEDSQSGISVDEIKLDEATFRKCKEKMRTERKSLQSLQNPDDTITEKDQVQNTKRCLLKIGDHIEKCLDDYNNNPEDLDMWRNNLWSFVAKFTEFGAAKLHKLYRTAYRKRDAVRDEQKREIQKLKESYSNSLHEMGKFLPPDRLEMEEARKRALGLNSATAVKKIPKLDRIRIPHKKKESSSNENEQQHYQGAGSENYGEVPPRGEQQPHNDEYGRDAHRRDDYYHRNENWRGRGGYHRGGNNHRGGYHHDQQQGRYNRKPYRDHQYRHHPDENSGGKSQQTYREWKESQNKHNVPYDEKPHSETPHTHGKTNHKDRPTDRPPHRDDKNSHKNGANNVGDPRDKYRNNQDADGSPGYDYSHTQGHLKSPESLSIYPGGENWSRKRTLSNNSDGSGGTQSKQMVRDPDHSPNSNQSWASAGAGNT